MTREQRQARIVAAALLAVAIATAGLVGFSSRTDLAEAVALVLATVLAAAAGAGLAAGRAQRPRGAVADGTEREHDLRSAEELLQGVIDATQDLIFVKSAGLTYVTCNQAFVEFTGRPKEAIVGHDDFGVFADRGAAEAFRAWDRKILADGTQHYIEEWVTYPDGRRVPLETLKSPVRGGDGRLLGLVGISRDITDRKRGEEALRESRNLLQTVLDTIPARVFWKDRDLTYLGCNRPFARDAGVESPEEIIGKDDFRMGWREQAELYRSDDRRVLESGEPKRNYEEPQTTPDGRRIWLRTNKAPLRSANGEVLGVLGTYEDITEQKRAEASLRQAALIVENSPVMLFRWEAREGWPIALVSQNVVQLGYTPEELLDGPALFAPMVHPDDRERVAREVRNYAASGVDRFQQEYRILTKAGQARWVDDRTVVERDDAGRITHYQGIVVDITDRKRGEAERERLIAELEIRNEELERFTYTVSHDLRSPLITIRGFLGYIARDALAGNAARVEADVGRIAEAAEKMDRLLRELLELSRVGRVINPSGNVPFEEIAREAVSLVAGALAPRGVRVEIAAGMPTVLVDRVRVVEAVQNLLDNAAKFMGDQPAPRVEIGALPEQRDGKPVLFVRDNGIGIESKYQKKVFGLFDKLDPATEGTGIGLAIVKRIVEVHGGTVWIDSAGPGGGSTFYFTLPRALEGPRSGG